MCFSQQTYFKIISLSCCVFRPATACPFAWSKTMKNTSKLWKNYLFHVRRMKKNEEKSLLVSDWEWLPKAGWHLKAGCSFGCLSMNMFHDFLMLGMRSLVKIHNNLSLSFSPLSYMSTLSVCKPYLWNIPAMYFYYAEC